MINTHKNQHFLFTKQNVFVLLQNSARNTGPLPIVLNWQKPKIVKYRCMQINYDYTCYN